MVLFGSNALSYEREEEQGEEVEEEEEGGEKENQAN